LTRLVGRKGLEPLTPCASCTPDRPVPSALVRPDLPILGQAFKVVPTGTAGA
jgi:hypothetical protein